MHDRRIYTPQAENAAEIFNSSLNDRDLDAQRSR